jgi:F-type H+-transporting ATPase subunit a
MMPFGLAGFATDITVGEHVVHKVLGLSLDLDTIWATAAGLVVVFLLGLALRRQVSRPTPGKLQVAFEMGVSAVTKQVEGSIGPAGQAIIPLAVALFVFIFVCNCFESIGLGSHFEWLAAPTGDINLPLAMAVFVILLVHVASIRARGILGYVKHYAMQPFPVVLLPYNLFMNIVEEVARPVTLALRLFGNLLSGTLMLSVIAALGAWKLSGAPVGDVVIVIINPIWKVFDLAIGAIQAFIFALLTILYFDVAMSGARVDRVNRRGLLRLPARAEPLVTPTSS